MASMSALNFIFLWVAELFVYLEKDGVFLERLVFYITYVRLEVFIWSIDIFDLDVSNFFLLFWVFIGKGDLLGDKDDILLGQS